MDLQKDVGILEEHRKSICGELGHRCSRCPYNIIDGCNSFTCKSYDNYSVGEYSDGKYNNSGKYRLSWENALLSIITNTQIEDFPKIEPLFQYAVDSGLYGIKIL